MDEPTGTLDLVVNGARLAEVDTADLDALDKPLRGVAAAHSPVLLLGDPFGCEAAARTLHRLGPRAELEQRTCRTPTEAVALLSAGDAEAASPPGGTWVLVDVASWPKGAQDRLERALARFDAGRLMGELGPRQLPRVIVVHPDGASGELGPELVRRLGFFKVRLGRTS